MSDFEDFEELFAKEADNNDHAVNENYADENLTENRLNEEIHDSGEEVEDYYYEDDEKSQPTVVDNVELDEYLSRKIHHLCISLSTFMNNTFDITATTLSNLKQLKQGLHFDSNKLESHAVFIQLYKNNILIHDLIPILGLYSSTNSPSDYLKKCVIRTLELVYKLTSKIELDEQSSTKEVEEYTEVKKIQLTYKKQLLNSKALTAFVKLLMTNCLTDSNSKTESSDKIVIFVINIIKNMLALEPFEVILSGEKWKKLRSKQLNMSSCLPKGVSLSDIDINETVRKFNESGLFPVLIKITQFLGKRKGLFQNPDEEERIYIPLMDIWFTFVKDLSPNLVQGKPKPKQSVIATTTSSSETKLATLLARDKELKKKIISNTSSRHSKFGSLITIETGQNKRTQVTTINNKLLGDTSLDFLDDNKKDLPKLGSKKVDSAEGWVKSEYLTSFFDSDFLSVSTVFNEWVDKFIFSKAFLNLATIITEQLKEDGFDENPEVSSKYLIFINWFVEYQHSRCKSDTKFAKLLPKLITINNTGLIKLIFEMYAVFGTEKDINHCVVHAFNKLYVNLLKVITENSKAVLTYYLVILYILKHDTLHNSMILYPRKLQSSSNVTLQESSIVLLSYLIKFKEQLNNFTVEQTKYQNDAEIRHVLTKLAKTLNFENFIDTFEIINTSFLDLDLRINYGFIFHHETITAIVSLLGASNHLSYSSKKTILKLLNICQKNQPLSLQRIDLLLQLRSLSKTTPKSHRLYPHISAFSTFYLTAFTKALAKNPNSGPIECLFIKKNTKVNQLYRDKEFLKSGELSKEFLEAYLCVKVSELKSEVVTRLDALTPIEALKTKFGMIIGALLEKDNQHLVECVLAHLKAVKLAITEQKRDQTDFVLRDPVGENGERSIVVDKNSKRNSDFRLFLTMLGYKIPRNADQSCELPQDIELSKLNFNITIIVTFTEHPLELLDESDISMHSMFIRFDEKKKKNSQKTASSPTEDSDYDENVSEEYSKNDGFVISDGDSDDEKNSNSLNSDGQDEYFRQLIKKNVKKTETLNKKGPVKKHSKTVSGGKTSRIKARKSTIVSKALLSSSSDDDSEETDVIFFENELYSKLVTLIHNGQLTSELQNKMNRFRSLRESRGVISDEEFGSLFKGAVPRAAELNSLIQKFKQQTGNGHVTENDYDFDDPEPETGGAALQLTQAENGDEERVRLGRINRLRQVMGQMTGARAKKRGLLDADGDNSDEDSDNSDGDSENSDGDSGDGSDGEVAAEHAQQARKKRKVVVDDEE